MLEYEYLNYNQYSNAHKTKWETVLRWTYEINENIAFSPEVTFKVEKYNNSKENYLIESSAGPYVLFTKNINDDFGYMEKLEFLFFVKMKVKLKDIDIQNHKHQHMVKLDLNIFFRRNK